MNRKELQTLLDGVDMAHAELIHSRLSFDFVTFDLLLPVGWGVMEKYRLLSERLFKNDDVSVLLEMNELCCDILSAVEEEELLGKNRAREIIEYIKKLSDRPIRKFEASFDEVFAFKWKNGMAEQSDVEAIIKILSPFLLKVVEFVKRGRFEAAVGNLFLLFDCLGDVRVEHEDWFEHQYSGGLLTDVEFLTDVAAEVYSHLRQRPDLPKELAFDMDNYLLLQNRRNGLFGDWTLSIYADMLYTLGYQSEDYSDIEKLDAWQEFQAFAKEYVA